ncbi:chemotaxis protein CheW [Desulfopila aestuarii]|uniref:CheW-like domain-containing protein n=1 Tax=Desulfopila aestuarii DSM 18488 TaxID=1121416 RepID=A0A1M7YCH7_9BACT|nr:chemotaxis protein CheW [Desulfopila aestuarii]SHO50276.1 CheW-like domain-containing protein [Desulfopila aestuarii DSM 18488]
MSTLPQTSPEVAMIMANTPPIDGWNIYWLISKRQVEYILTDIAKLPPSAEHPHLERAQYQEEMLPVVSLEKHFGLEESTSVSSYRYIVTKSPTPEGKLVKAILRFSHPIRVRKLNFNSVTAQHTGLRENAAHILGAFTLPDNQLVIIPDIPGILQRS